MKDLSQDIIGRDCILSFLKKTYKGKVLMRSQKWWDPEEPWFFFDSPPRFPWKVKEIIKEGGVINPI